MKQKLTYYFLFIATGVLAGYFYYEFYGCTRGCSITSVWYHSSAYGGIMGYLTAGLFKSHFLKHVKKQEK